MDSDVYGKRQFMCGQMPICEGGYKNPHT
jgi:hypothetical protein